MHPPLGRFHLDHTFNGRIAGGVRGTLLVNSLYIQLHTLYLPELFGVRVVIFFSTVNGRNCIYLLNTIYYYTL